MKSSTENSRVARPRWHGVIVHGRMFHGAVAVENRIGAEIDAGIEELGDERAEGVGLGQARDGVAEFEVIEDVLHVGRESVEVGFEIGSESLLPEVASTRNG
jgi:hypothetical protein